MAVRPAAIAAKSISSSGCGSSRALRSSSLSSPAVDATYSTLVGGAAVEATGHEGNQDVRQDN